MLSSKVQLRGQRNIAMFKWAQLSFGFIHIPMQNKLFELQFLAFIYVES